MKNIKTSKTKLFGLDDEELQKSMNDYVQYLHVKRQIKDNHLNRIRNIEIDTLITWIKKTHTKEFEDKYFKRGEMPHPTNIFLTLFDLAENDGIELDLKERESFNDIFPISIYFYKDYYFETIWGQGVINTIYDKDKNILLTL